MISFVSVFLRLKKIASNLLRGFAMGIADVVHGVSGGTIALDLGIYAVSYTQLPLQTKA